MAASNLYLEIPFTDNFQEDPENIDSLRLVLTGDESCDIVLNKAFTGFLNSRREDVFGNGSLYSSGFSNTNEDYCIVIITDYETSSYECRLYSTKDLSSYSNTPM